MFEQYRKIQNRIKVFIVEDHKPTCDDLTAFLHQEEDIEIVGSTPFGHAAFDAIQAQQTPLVLLLDLNLPDTTGWALLNRCQGLPTPPICLVLSVKDEEFFCRRLLKAGARGYLMKGAPYARIAEAIRAVKAGEIVVSQHMATLLIEEALEIPEGAPDPALEIQQLSDRELQVLDFIVQGKRNKDIATALFLSEKTVATYKTRLMKKLDVCTTPELLNAARGVFRKQTRLKEPLPSPPGKDPGDAPS